MGDVLQRICADKRRHVAGRREVRSMGALLAAAGQAAAVRPFAESLSDAVSAGGYGLVAEIKRASPSKGLIRHHFVPAELAQAYQAGGAACLSVLTDKPYFQGADEFLVEARAAASLPVLRKDFMLDPYQIAESRALGADCVLLILAAVDDAQAAELESAAWEMGMDVLIEVHDQAEMERAHRLESRLIGINNRDLKSLEVDLATTERLAPLAPAKSTVVSESGVGAPADLARLSRAGVDCFLVAESLMVSADVEAATRALLAHPQPNARRA